jgi:hypothetical protein
MSLWCCWYRAALSAANPGCYGWKDQQITLRLLTWLVSSYSTEDFDSSISKLCHRFVDHE